MATTAFNRFVKLLRQRDDYDEIIESKDDDSVPAKQWLCLLFIRSMIDEGMKIYEIVKYVPKEYKWIIKEFIETTIAPRRLLVNWKLLARELANVPPCSAETIKYIQAHQPVRYFAILGEG